MTAIADTPCLVLLVGNKQVVQPLRRVTLERKRRRRERAWTIYGIFEVPDTEVVPRELVGASVRIPHNSPQKERESVPHTRRTRALSPIPESDPWFDEIYGIREDSESINSDIKNRLPHSRCRTPGAENLTFELLAYQLMVLIKALNSYCRRTGADSTRWFGKQPPTARAGPLRLAASQPRDPEGSNLARPCSALGRPARLLTSYLSCVSAENKTKSLISKKFRYFAPVYALTPSGYRLSQCECIPPQRGLEFTALAIGSWSELLDGVVVGHG